MFQRLPSHHHSERAHHASVISVTEHTSPAEEPEQLTQDDILDGDSFEGLIAKESVGTNQFYHKLVCSFH